MTLADAIRRVVESDATPVEVNLTLLAEQAGYSRQALYQKKCGRELVEAVAAALEVPASTLWQAMEESE